MDLGPLGGQAREKRGELRPEIGFSMGRSRVKGLSARAERGRESWLGLDRSPYRPIQWWESERDSGYEPKKQIALFKGFLFLFHLV